MCFDFFLESLACSRLRSLVNFARFNKFGSGLMFLLRKSIHHLELIYFCGRTCRACVSGSDAGANFVAEHTATRCAARRNSWTVTRRSDKDIALTVSHWKKKKNKNHEWTVDAVFTSIFSHSYCYKQFVISKVKCVCKGDIIIVRVHSMSVKKMKRIYLNTSLCVAELFWWSTL